MKHERESDLILPLLDNCEQETLQRELLRLSTLYCCQHAKQFPCLGTDETFVEVTETG